MFFLSRSPGMSSQYDGSAMHWKAAHAVLDQTHPQLGQLSKHYIITVLLYKTSLYTIGFTDPLLFPIVLCTHHSSWCCRNKQVREDGYARKCLGLHHPWVNPPLSQRDCLREAPWWLKGSIWPWQVSLGTLNMSVLPFPHPQAHQQCWGWLQAG